MNLICSWTALYAHIVSIFGFLGQLYCGLYLHATVYSNIAVTCTLRFSACVNVMLLGMCSTVVSLTMPITLLPNIGAILL